MMINYMLIIMKEELLIDFHELIGKHTGENMAEVVWETLTLYGLCEKVAIKVNCLMIFTSEWNLGYCVHDGQRFK